MAIGCKKNNGLDLSGVGHKSIDLPGGDMKTRSGLQMGPDKAKAHRVSGGPARKGNYVRHTASNGGKREKKIPRRTLALVISIVVGALALAIAVGAFVYQMTVRNALRIELNTSGLEEVLSDPEEDATGYWSALVKTDASSSEVGHGDLTDLALVWADTEEQSISFLWIPADTRVYMDGYGYRTVKEAFSLQGEVGVVSAVERLASVEVSHYAEINNAGLARMEESLAPLDVDTSTADASTLSSSLCRKMFATSSDQLSTVGTMFSTCVSTDMTQDEVDALFQGLHGVEASNIYQATAPVEQEENAESALIDTDSWRTMVTRTSNGMSPVATESELARYERMRSDATVTIWNGVGVSGVGADCESELIKLGWNVRETGNAAQFVYEETFIIYKDTDDKELAELLASDMRQGRVVRSAARYNYEGTLLVVIGSDYQPY